MWLILICGAWGGTESVRQMILTHLNQSKPQYPFNNLYNASYTQLIMANDFNNGCRKNIFLKKI